MGVQVPLRAPIESMIYKQNSHPDLRWLFWSGACFGACCVRQWMLPFEALRKSG